VTSINAQNGYCYPGHPTTNEKLSKCNVMENGEWEIGGYLFFDV
jgi:hypothetical protein